MKKIISSWIGIFVGCTILAAGFVYSDRKQVVFSGCKVTTKK